MLLAIMLSYVLIAELMVLMMAAALGSLVIVLSNCGAMINAAWAGTPVVSAIARNAIGTTRQLFKTFPP